jgi:predicted DNA-binding transcriptional regulator AlpA
MLAHHPSQTRSSRTTNLALLDGAPDETLISYADLSALSGFAVVTLRLWHREKKKKLPQVRRIEGRPRFRLGDVREWLKGDAAQPEHA